VDGSEPPLGPWAPLGRDEVAGLLDGTGVRWWFAGGHALELHLGRSWRGHADVDVGVLRTDVAALADALEPAREVWLAAAGRLHALPGRALRPDRHENNLWVRAGEGEPWCLDVVVSEGDAAGWGYRRRPDLRVPWAEAVLHDPAGRPYLAPELQLLHKSVRPRPKDDEDAAVVVPALDPPRRARLAALLAPDHPWLRLVG
jgi:hypothetical protein